MLYVHKYYAKIAFNLHFKPQRTFVTIFMPLLFSAVLSGQEPVSPDVLLSPDSLPQTETLTVYDTLFNREVIFPQDTLTADSALVISPDAVDLPIVYTADGYMKTDLKTKKVSLIQNAKVTYGTIELKADSIVLDMETGSVYATGRIDSTGKMAGKPVYKDGGEEFESKEITYNFKSKKGVIQNITTQQEGGYLQSQKTKRQEDGTLHVNKSKFTTCDLEDPHFYLALNKAKVYPNEKMVSGPAYMVVADVPLPLIVPFGYFPVQQKRASGLIVPRYGQEARRGYFLSNGGYYFALTDYFDMKLTGTAYTNGTWLADAATTYKLRYRFSGSFGFSYANNITSYKGLPDYGSTTNYRLTWSHSQDPKSSPGSRFSASVNMSSSGYDRENSYEVADHVTTTRQSSISYSKNWAGTPISFSTSLNQSQNVQNKTLQLNLPKASLTVSRIYPFKPRKPVVKKRWYHDIQSQYTASLDNKIDAYDSLLFTSQTWNNMKNGFKHEVPLSFQIRPFKNFSISPQMRYTGVLYTQQIEKRWDPTYYNESLNKIVPSVINDTIRGLTYGQSLVPSIGASYNTQLDGRFTFTKKGSKIETIRHLIKPALGFSYAPELNWLVSDMIKTVQYDTLGNEKEYSIYEGSIYGTPTGGRRSGSLTFGLVNIVEAKVFAKNDTTGKPKKVKLIDNLSFNTSYNIFADSLNWAPVSAQFRTTLAENINVMASSSFSIYGLSPGGTMVSELALSQGMGLFRMTSFNTSVDLDVARLFKGKTNDRQQTSSGAGQAPDGQRQEGARSAGNLPLDNRNYDEYGYVRFDVPWSLRMAYNFNYSKPAYKSNISQTMTLSGDLRLTPKMAINYSTGYDFKQQEITMSRVGISRDLHCWEMNFSWIPIGYMKSWNFLIRAKAGMLNDLKYERKKDYHENL